MIAKVFKILLTILSPLLVVIGIIMISFIIQFVYLGTKGYKMKGKIPQVRG